MLDVPSGTGRLGGVLGNASRNVTAIDISWVMLAECEAPTKIQASAEHLPLRADSYDAVLCCRLLHHLSADARRQVVEELCRVSRGLVIASFWDATSWHALRRRLGLRRGAHPSSRRAVSRRELQADFEAAGATVLGHASSLRFVSPQTFLAARVHGS
ncbi:MAG: class I SAM-dependent methyltransferase [Planctomycetota bacterium]|nr:class I SAM-dependent methyltransferase [Planctomycetota bacterium]